MSSAIPVLAIDGPSGSGKGTVSRAVARSLGWNFLDSGAIYRSLAMAVIRADVSWDDMDKILNIAEEMQLEFSPTEPPEVWLNGENVIDLIATETCGSAASCIAASGPVRHALLDKQKSFRRPPGLVADGRDMGTMVFKDAQCKIFLTASAEVRAIRRYKQLKDKGLDVNLASLTREIEDRDRRDRERAESPLVMAEDAILIDSSNLDVHEVIQQVLQHVG